LKLFARQSGASFPTFSTPMSSSSSSAVQVFFQVETFLLNIFHTYPQSCAAKVLCIRINVKSGWSWRKWEIHTPFGWSSENASTLTHCICGKIHRRRRVIKKFSADNFVFRLCYISFHYLNALNQ